MLSFDGLKKSNNERYGNNKLNRSNSTTNNDEISKSNNNPFLNSSYSNFHDYKNNNNQYFQPLISNDLVNNNEYAKKHSRNITSDYLQCKSNKYSTLIIKHNKPSCLLGEKNNSLKEKKSLNKSNSSEKKINNTKEENNKEKNEKIDNKKNSDNTKNIITKNNLLKFNELKKEKNLSNKECAFYMLANSPVLRLCDRLIFARSTPALRNIISIEDILKKNEEFLQAIIEEYKNKINQCNHEIVKPFYASKTADITLNFITMAEEEEFRELNELMVSDQEKNLYYDYYRLIFLLFNEKYPEENGEIVFKELYNKVIYKKKFISIKDYLYHIYIAKKQDNHILDNIDKINELISREADFFKKHSSLKMCKFVCFSLYLFQEIIQYGNGIKDAILLKKKTENFLDIVYDKLDMYRIKAKNKKTKNNNKYI